MKQCQSPRDTNFFHTFRREMSSLRAASANAHKGAPGPLNDWLRDNWYALDGEIRQALRMRRRLRDPAAFGRLVLRLAPSVRAGKPVCEATLRRALEPDGERPPWSYEQLACVESALRCALLRRAAEALRSRDGDSVIGYAVGGLYAAGSIDFGRLAEEFSASERIFSRDPSGAYPRTDAQSRARLRERAWLAALRRGESEETRALEYLRAARGAKEDPQDQIGWQIVSDPVWTGLLRRRGSLFRYMPFACAALLSGALSILPAASAGGRAALFLLVCLPVYALARPLCERLCLRGVPPAILPRVRADCLDPRETRAVMTVSTLLEGGNVRERVRERLLDLYSSNRYEGLSYCILADLAPSAAARDARDDALIAQARAAVEELCETLGPLFFLFVRARAYSETQGCWQGRERKRGAIGDLARFCLGDPSAPLCAAGNAQNLLRARYLIALDSDTRPGLDAAARLVAAAAHPQNRPRRSPDGRTVVSGWGILTPRVRPGLESAAATPFSRLTAGCGGVSGYASHERCPYQDLFGQSLFTGKGLIDIACFHDLCMAGLPPEQILSHDIVEGGLARCAFLGDVEMTDEEPPNLSAWLDRMHRWVRGDWQNAPFLRAGGAGGRHTRAALHPVTRLHIGDNLLRSLIPAAQLACVAAAVFWGRARGILLVAGAGGAALPALLGGLAQLFPFGLTRRFFTAAAPRWALLLCQALTALITLPARALCGADAAVRALWRLNVSRRRLLEWTTAAQSGARRAGAGRLLRRYLLPLLFGLAVLLCTPLRFTGFLFSLILPFAGGTARPDAPAPERLDEGQRRLARGYTADMMRFFLDYATPGRFFLPPDNVQSAPRFLAAERTSPTNIGFMLLSFLAARDFGLITAEELLKTVGRVLGTLERMEKWRGNLYNWYDIRTLKILPPAFVSSVDSGNLIGCLIALRQGLLEEGNAEAPGAREAVRRLGALIEACDLSAFYLPVRKLFSIGYDSAENKLRDAHYDFLMSEARLLSFCALGRREAGREHWGALSRAMSRSGAYAGPLSWTGTMFEYYMPHLVLPVFGGSLLDEALRYAFYCQKRRTRAQKLPWGISESSYFAFDDELQYQYKAHGAGALGVKRGLDDETVLSPYSTFLVLPRHPDAALENLGALREMGLYGEYGFYEAADCTPGRAGAGLSVVRSYMAHHIGMSVTACANAAFDGIMQKRFLRDPHMRGAREFLEERLPTEAARCGRRPKRASAPRRDVRPDADLA